MSGPTEPEDLARELGITGKRLRAWLRSHHGRSEVEHGSRWTLSPAVVDDARWHFGKTARTETAGEVSAASQVAANTPNHATVGASAEAALVRRRRAAGRHRPKHVRLLLVAEAPPAAIDRYFYFDDVRDHDSLFRYVVRGVLGVEPSRTSKASLLTDLRDEGVFLIDVAEEPSGAADLRQHVPGLVERCRQLSPDAVVLIKAPVFDAAYEPLVAAGVRVVDRRIPFPGSGQQRRFEAEFHAALTSIGWSLRS